KSKCLVWIKSLWSEVSLEAEELILSFKFLISDEVICAKQKLENNRKIKLNFSIRFFIYQFIYGYKAKIFVRKSGQQIFQNRNDVFVAVVQKHNGTGFHFS